MNIFDRMVISWISIYFLFLFPVSPIFELTLRMTRNFFMDKYPPLIENNNACSFDELKRDISLVITVKDTCSQKEDLLKYIMNTIPSSMDIIYVSPNISGCIDVTNTTYSTELKKNYAGSYKELYYDPSKAPIEGFHVAYKYINTPYAVLMHNDAYPMEPSFYCNLYKGLKKNPQYPIAAPTIYEKGDLGIYLPHGHHENLHVRSIENNRYKYLIDYDISYEMATRRRAIEFKESEQRDFLEDHAFFVKTDDFRKFLDPLGSFTMEYIDMIMNVRENGTSVWYVPSARVVFDVALSKFKWNDLPYFVYKRSEEIGLKTRDYLSEKWNVLFPNTGIWNFVKYNFIKDLKLHASELPENKKDMFSVILSWFQSVGFNRFNGLTLPEILSNASHAFINQSIIIERKIIQNQECDNKSKKYANHYLPVQEKKTFGRPNLKIGSLYQQLGINIRNCSDTVLCGMRLYDNDTCLCYTMAPIYNIYNISYIMNFLELMKLPSRAFMYMQMGWNKNNVSGSDIFCPEIKVIDDDTECKLVFNYTTALSIDKWSWFG